MNTSPFEIRCLKAARILHKVRKKFWRRGDANRVYFPQRVAQYRSIWKAVAEHVGAQFRELADDTWEITLDGGTTRIVNYQLEFDNPVVLDIAGKKPLMHGLLKAAGLAVPAHDVFSLSAIDKAYTFLGEHPLGVVIKPADGSAGLGVTTHVESQSDVRRAAVLASLYADDLLVEAQIPGECYRLLVLEGKMVHAVCRRGPRLVGDGNSTVEQLIQSESSRLQQLGQGRISIDRNLLFTVRHQQLSLQMVPERGATFVAKTIPDDRDSFVELRTVYDTTVTDLICDSVRKAAQRAARVLGSEFVGVDIITSDPTVPLEDVGGVINEVNTTPALHHHYDSKTEKFPGVAVEVLNTLLRRSRSRV